MAKSAPEMKDLLSASETTVHTGQPAASRGWRCCPDPRRRRMWRYSRTRWSS